MISLNNLCSATINHACICSLQVVLHLNCKIFVEGTLRKGNCLNIATCRDVLLYIFMMYFAHFVTCRDVSLYIFMIYFAHFV